jgi:hypothetical protein
MKLSKIQLLTVGFLLLVSVVIASASAASITVTSPNGGETWQQGSQHMITWSYTGDPGPYVKIELLKGGYAVGTASYSTSIGTSGKGSYSWTISSTRAPGTDYRIRVTSVSQPTISDTSNGNFAITASGTTKSSITVTSPNGGESWFRGKPYWITWTYTGSPGSKVKIVLLNGGLEVGTITHDTSIGANGKGSYPWTISSTRAFGNYYKVSVQSVNQPTIKDMSNGNFSISPVMYLTPTIISITPSNVNTAVTNTQTYNIYGSHFETDAEVQFIKSACLGCPMYYATKEVTVSPTHISCSLSTPRIPDGYYTIYVRNPGQNWVYKSNALFVYYLT